MPVATRYEQWRTGEPDDRFPDCCENKVLGIVCEHCSAEEPYRDLCPFVRQMDRDAAFEGAWEEYTEQINTVWMYRHEDWGALSDREIVRKMRPGLDADAMTDAEATAVIDGILHAPEPAVPARLFPADAGPSAQQILEIVGAIFNMVKS